MIVPAQHSMTGLTVSKMASSHPTIASSVPSSASFGVRPSGASTMCPPFDDSSLASFTVEPGSAVEVSITIKPGRAPARMPSSPRRTSST